MQQLKNNLAYDLDHPGEAFGKLTEPFGAGGAAIGTFTKSGKIAAFLAKLFSKESVAERLVLSSEKVLDAAIKNGPERIVGFTIDGTKAMVGNTMQRDVLRLATDAGPGMGNVRQLLGAMEGDALSAGATSLRIVGHEIQNVTFFRNAAIAERLGYTFNKLDDKTFELVKVLTK